MTSRAQPSKRTSRGRQKIEIKRRETIDARRVTFAKRRTGLFEKAAELCVLCGARVAIITFSEGRKAFCFSYPDTDALLEEYLIDRGYPTELADVYPHATNEEECLFREVTRQLDIEKAGLKSRRERQSFVSDIGCPWWEEEIEELGPEELEFFNDSLEKLMNRAAVKLDEMMIQESPLHQSLVGIGHDNVAEKDWFVEGSSRTWSDNLL